MTNSPNKKRYNAEYAKLKLKRIPLDVKLDRYEEIKKAADALGVGVNTYVKIAIREKMERDGMPWGESCSAE